MVVVIAQDSPSDSFRAQTEASNIRIVTPNYKTGEKPVRIFVEFREVKKRNFYYFLRDRILSWVRAWSN